MLPKAHRPIGAPNTIENGKTLTEAKAETSPRN